MGKLLHKSVKKNLEVSLGYRTVLILEGDADYLYM